MFTHHVLKKESDDAVIGKSRLIIKTDFEILTRSGHPSANSRLFSTREI